MKIEKLNGEESNFKPIEYKLTVQTRDELEFLKELGGSDYTLSVILHETGKFGKLSRSQIQGILTKFYYL